MERGARTGEGSQRERNGSLGDGRGDGRDAARSQRAGSRARGLAGRRLRVSGSTTARPAVLCHDNGTPTDATCTSCHPGFVSYPDDTCWTCHYPGQDTSTLSTPGTACSQECHLWNAAQKAYTIPSTHGANPHLGSSSDCTACHATSVSIFDPGVEPASQRAGDRIQRLRRRATSATRSTPTRSSAPSATRPPRRSTCTRRAARASRTAAAATPCGTPAGRSRNSKCATCHKGTGSGPATAAQHSTSITKKYVCAGRATRKKLHASAVSKRVKNCRTCHTGKYHGAQGTPGKSVCTQLSQRRPAARRRLSRAHCVTAAPSTTRGPAPSTETCR